MVLCGLVVGDTLNYRAMLLIGYGRAFPIANSYPLVTLGVAALWLGESIGWRELLGCLVTLAGVMLVALPPRRGSERALSRRTNLIGVGLALTVAVLWAGANSFAKLALLAIDTVTANAVRLPVAALLAWLLLGQRWQAEPPWRLPARTLAALLVTGIGAATLAGLLTLYGVQQIGAARASILGATSPLIAVPLSRLVLRERLPARVGVGVLLSVIGIWLIV
jgi:drug/metabolite transporter (DMT)-like permease